MKRGLDRSRNRLFFFILRARASRLVENAVLGEAVWCWGGRCASRSAGDLCLLIITLFSLRAGITIGLHCYVSLDPAASAITI